MSRSRIPRRSRKRKVDYSTDVSLWLVASGFPMPEKEFIFDVPKPGKKRRLWRLDLAYPEWKIAIELHGMISDTKPCSLCKQPKVGRHLRIKGYTEDREKMNAAQVQGWIVIECAMPTHWNNGLILDWLKDAAYSRGMPFRDSTTNERNNDDD